MNEPITVMENLNPLPKAKWKQHKKDRTAIYWPRRGTVVKRTTKTLTILLTTGETITDKVYFWKEDFYART